LLTLGDETVRLEPKTMEVLVYFASRPSEVITRDELERDVWRGAIVGYDAITNTVIKLRKALQDSAKQPRYIATIPKKGYKLIAAIRYPDHDEDDSQATPVSHPERADSPPDRPLLKKNRAGLLIAMLSIVTILLMAGLWVSSPEETNSEITQDADYSTALPSIVVLPFENISNDPKQENLADGITEDIITDLSRLSNLLIISSNTSNKYKGKQVSPEEIGADLNVGFVLKGSIRRLGDELRVNAQLVNTRTGFNVWAQRYDSKAIEMFEVQDKLTESIVKALAVKLTLEERQRVTHRVTDSLKAYDFFQEGQRISKAYTKQSNEQAREMYRKAIELDPGYGRAYGAQAVTLAFDFQRGWTDSPVATLDRALELAKKAVELNETTPQTHWALGFVYLWRKEYQKADEAVENAIAIAPNYADGYGLLSLIKSFHGQPEKAIELNDRAIRLNPYYTFEYLMSYGIAYFALGKYDAAIEKLEQAQARNMNAVQVKMLLVANYVEAGRQDDAEWEVSEIQILNPTATISELKKVMPFAKPEIMHAFLEGLRKAGLPE
jgi:TolB-like protein/DNA-binding winged helix-turn-helix (wHTH) protein